MDSESQEPPFYHPNMSKRNRFPTFLEVMSRETLPPVDLFSFYIYMRDQYNAVDYLDFWLDVAQHTSLCRHYVRELRRGVLVAESQSREEVSDPVTSGGLPGTEPKNNHPTQEGSIQGSHDSPRDREEQDFSEIPDEMKLENSSAQMDRRLSEPSVSTSAATVPESSSSAYELVALHLRGGGLDSPPSAGSEQNSLSGDINVISVTRKDIRASAEKILYTYLLPGAEREIVLPESMASDISKAIEESGKDDPETFEAAKDLVFQMMERDAFPGFLAAKGLGNLTHLTLLSRMVFGLMSVFAGFWLALSLLFLDEPRRTRIWVILPFTLGTYSLISYVWALDPILAFLGQSEYTFFAFVRVQEPYVFKILIRRAIAVFAVILMTDAALVAFFIFIPGRKL